MTNQNKGGSLHSQLQNFWNKIHPGSRSKQEAAAAAAAEEENKKEDAATGNQQQQEIKAATPPGRKWDYKQQGADWGPVLASGITCTRQSPIEIDSAAIIRLIERFEKGEEAGEEAATTGNKVQLGTADLCLINKLADAAGVKEEKQVVFDCGHKLQLKPTEENPFGEVERGEGENKEIYKVQQFHFHAPAEHTLGDIRHAVELHIVCKCINEGKGDQHLVIGVLFEGKEEEKTENVFLRECEAALFAFLPDAEKDKLPNDVKNIMEEAKGGILENKKGIVDLKTLVKEDATIVFYYGSLTTPPCTENVLWYVVHNPIPITKEQAKRFEIYLKSGEGEETRGNFRLRQNVEVKANEQILYVLTPSLFTKKGE